MAEKGEADCYFSFKEIYPLGRKNGTPEKILFIITTSDLGREQGKSILMAKKLIAIEEVLKNDFGFRTSEIRKIVPRITEDNMDVFMAKMQEVKEYMMKEESKILDKKKYAFTALRNVIDDFEEAVAEEIFEELPLFSKREEKLQKAAKERKSADRSPWDGMSFRETTFRDKLTSVFGARVYTMYLMQVRVVTFKNETVSLLIPHEEVSDYIDSNNLIGQLKECLSSIMGKVQSINYLVGV